MLNVFIENTWFKRCAQSRLVKTNEHTFSMIQRFRFHRNNTIVIVVHLDINKLWYYYIRRIVSIWYLHKKYIIWTLSRNVLFCQFESKSSASQLCIQSNDTWAKCNHQPRSAESHTHAHIHKNKNKYNNHRIYLYVFYNNITSIER